jgi:hypothetical protein
MYRAEILKVHGTQVLENCIKILSVCISVSMFREENYREILHGKRNELVTDFLFPEGC